ncbi:MAG: hypothetical protein ABGW97_04195 [Christiangramia sp.]
MKRYTMYRDIRKEALIMGLPVMLFGVQIVALVLSLFLLIFSFSLVVLLAILLGNIGLYLGLLRYVSRNKSVTFFRVFPKEISNKAINKLPYEKNKFI